MQLSGEDLLRLNVMMAQNVKAVRIDENRMQVYGLTHDGEVRVDLNAVGKPQQYIKLVREFLSGHVFGSPGGYPVFLSRWTRMGQAKDENLQQLLMLGEPEAVVAVVHAQGLTPEVAEFAWWCMPESENARRMLEKKCIVESEMGVVLADHLYEHLAFETEPGPMIDSVRLMLQPGLINEEKRDKLWRSSQRKNAYLVGFLQALPDDLPHDRPEHQKYDWFRNRLVNVQDNAYAEFLLWLMSETGQRYLETAYSVLKKPANQDVVVCLLNTLHEQMKKGFPDQQLTPPRTIREIDEMANSLLSTDQHNTINDTAWLELIDTCGEDSHEIYSMAWLAQVGEPIVDAIFAQTTAEGTLMRKKLLPVTEPVFRHLDILLGKG
jgi:predicted SAM-dependent methyltransferase